MGRNEEFLNSIGISQHEAAAMEARARAGQLGEEIINHFGGAKHIQTVHQSNAYDHMREAGHDTEAINMDKRDGAPFVEHKVGGYTARWYGGQYADISHDSNPNKAIDLLNVSHHGALNKATAIQQQMEDWHKEMSSDY